MVRRLRYKHLGTIVLVQLAGDHHVDVAHCCAACWRWAAA